MNCEQKYNEARERAMKLSIDGYLDAVAIDEIFPELAESKDERIRKELIEHIKANYEADYVLFKKFSPDDVIAWLEKHDANKEYVFRPLADTMIENAVEQALEQGDVVLAFNGFYTPVKGKTSEEILTEYDNWIEKQGEQPTDKIEPKFKVGDWVILNGIVAKILDKQKYGFVGLDIDGKNFFCNYGHTDSMRLWSINDAKDGDVLLEEEIGEPFIYNGNRAIHFLGVHCGIYNGEFNPYGGIHHCGKNSHPATKEQRDLLFQKMKEAGYEWDAEKKELKKMEVVSKENEDERIRKALICGMYALKEQHKTCFASIPIDNAIAWLEKQGNMLDPDKVIEWLDEHAPTKFEDMQNYVNQFKKDFGLC